MSTTEGTGVPEDVEAGMSSSHQIRREHLADLTTAADEVGAALIERRAVERLWDRDHTLWSDDPTELADRLGWLEVIDEIGDDGDRIDALARSVVEDGVDRVVVMGMGGSSLFPEVIASTGAVPGRPRLEVLDSTDPAAVARVAGGDLSTTLFVVSSKSGTTIETRSHLAHVWDVVGVPDRFVAITDAGSELEALAVERGFREVFRNRSDIGGRYSALSHFGLVPAALAGVDWRALLAGAQAAVAPLRSDDPALNAGLRLGSVMGAAVRAGRDKLTISIDPRFATFGLWLEQLIAESTGKAGTGVVPVVGEPLGPVDVYGADRVFVALGDQVHPAALQALAEAGHPVVEMDLDDLSGLGAQVLVWEVATAVCGAVLGINPFDQPDVARAKAATAAVLAAPPAERTSPAPAGPGPLLDGLGAGDYLAIQAYVDPEDPLVEELEELRVRLRDHHRVATTFGLGPRFLHSSGQLHKGGPPSGVFIQIVGDDPSDVAIPDQPFTFGELKRAQADGDLATLEQLGLRAVRTTVALLARAADDQDR